MFESGFSNSSTRSKMVPNWQMKSTVKTSLKKLSNALHTPSTSVLVSDPSILLRSAPETNPELSLVLLVPPPQPSSPVVIPTISARTTLQNGFIALLSVISMFGFWLLRRIGLPYHPMTKEPQELPS
jgi:hypothetical protein